MGEPKFRMLDNLERLPNGKLQGPNQQCERTLGEMAPGSAGWTNKDGTRWRDVRYKSRGLDPDRCAMQAVYQVGNKKLCKKHAGIEALERVLKEDSPVR